MPLPPALPLSLPPSASLPPSLPPYLRLPPFRLTARQLQEEAYYIHKVDILC